ncbi:MAG TPA: TIGR02147 family protein [Bdellovibrionota bacterium]|nr:TIGR02147 family protein [Bdellovibrionota bacterium]
MDTSAPTVFAYTNYRQFLADFTDFKRKSRGLSYRYFSKRAKINCPNYIQLILSKRRNLTLQSAQKVSEGLGLKGYERKFFLSLVRLEGTKEGIKRLEILDDLKKFAQLGSKKAIKDESIHSSWLHAVIFELAVIKDFVLSTENVSKSLGAVATKKEIEESISFLIEKGYLEETEVRGVYRQKEIEFEPLNDLKNLNLQKSHIRFLELAKDKLNEDVSVREYQGITIAVPKSRFPELKAKIRSFVERLNQEYSGIPSDAVIRVQCCMFKLTQ